jgi:3-isopropylmalate dehydrogenase
MNIIAHPSSYDVLVMDNMFGDILSDEVAVLVASLGMLPSASLAGLPDFGTNGNKPIMGLYEPIHGSAPDIAGQGKANPVGTILSSSLMLRYSFGLIDEADAIVQAVEKSLNLGLRTADIAGGSNSSSTEEFTQTIVDNVSA